MNTKWIQQFLLFAGTGLMGLSSALAIDGYEPPQNTFLADSPWPMSHRNPYNQASSPLRGPEPGDNFSHDFKRTLPTSITLAYSNKHDHHGRRSVWGVTLGSIFKMDMNGNAIKKVDANLKAPAQDPLSGAYLVMDKDNNLFAPHDFEIRKYQGYFNGGLNSPIKRSDVFKIPNQYRQSDSDIIVGINMTYDGFVVLATAEGTVCAVSRDFHSHDCLILPDNQEVSNSIAVDETGGIFIVTNKVMNRVQWTGSQLSTNEADGAWTASYETGPDQPWPGRLGTGSGSTPSLMGTQGMDQFVVFTDGQEIVNLVLMWRGDIPEDWVPIAPGKDRRIAAEFPVTFGEDVTRSISEQSVLVRGYSAMVVNNDYALDTSNLPGLLSKTTVMLSNLPFNAPYGVERFSWNPHSRTLDSDWANSEISCPNGIPTMSAASNIAYCIGQRNSIWNLEGFDWRTGESLLYHPFGFLPFNNSIYAATQIGDHRDIVTGTFGGVIRVQAEQRNNVIIKASETIQKAVVTVNEKRKRVIKKVKRFFRF